MDYDTINYMVLYIQKELNHIHTNLEYSRELDRILINTDFIQIGNGEAVARDRIPHLAFDNFRSQAL